MEFVWIEVCQHKATILSTRRIRLESGGAVYFGQERDIKGRWFYNEHEKIMYISFAAAKSKKAAVRMRNHALRMVANTTFVLLPADHEVYNIYDARWPPRSITHLNESHFIMQRIDIADILKDAGIVIDVPGCESNS